MKRWLTSTFIVLYLGALSWGIVAHAVKLLPHVHPAMYFVVWDMFCGWSSYESRLQIIAEGESGRYYELAPPPWGEIKPFGNIGRRHYDNTAGHAPKIALNTLEHTRHEPITRIFVVEECWAKKYNLPDHLWKQLYYKEPQDRQTYYHLRYVMTPEGALLQTFPSWYDKQYSLAVNSNPRLKRESQLSRPFLAVDLPGESRKISKRMRPGGLPSLGDPRRMGAPLGN